MIDATVLGTVPATQPGFLRIKEPAPYFEARTTHGMCRFYCKLLGLSIDSY